MVDRRCLHDNTREHGDGAWYKKFARQLFDVVITIERVSESEAIYVQNMGVVTTKRQREGARGSEAG